MIQGKEETDFGQVDAGKPRFELGGMGAKLAIHFAEIAQLNSYARSKRCKYAWNSAIESCKAGYYLAVSLNSSAALRAEGRHMDNCVASYDERCFAGLARAFGILDRHASRLATMSLILKSDQWNLEQTKGYRNAEITEVEWEYCDIEAHTTAIEMTDLHDVAHKVLRRYFRAVESIAMSDLKCNRF